MQLQPDKMTEFPEQLRLEAGIYVRDFIKWLQINFEPLFDSIVIGLTWVLIHIDQFLQWLPWWAFILIVFFLGTYFKSLIAGLTYALMLLIIGSFGLWDLLMYTVSIVVTSVIISVILGIPIGIYMAYSKRFETFMKPLLDAMQTMPSFVYLIPAMILFGLGKVPAIFATLIYAIPPVIRLTNLAIRNVSSEMVEAAEAFGSSRWQLLTKVQLPQAMPTIMTGVNQTTMMALAMVVIASMIGAEGLGMEVLTAINRIDIAMGFEAGISIVFLAIIIDRITLAISERSQKRK